MQLASIPSPSISQIEVGPLTIHMYALCIMVGVVVAIIVGNRRFIKVGGKPGVVGDVAITAVPAGVLGGRLYHVITSPDQYFGKNGDPISALYIWRGGMGIWGAIALGFAGALLAYRRLESEIPFSRLADALAPGLLLAQSIGRWGNWFNKELFGRPFDGPWGLQIPLEYRPAGFTSTQYFHPVFLYESIWCLLIAIFLMRAKSITRLRAGSTFALYVALYSIGRALIEMIRIDDAHHFFGLRLNIWTSLICVVGASYYLIRNNKRAALQ